MGLWPKREPEKAPAPQPVDWAREGDLMRASLELVLAHECDSNLCARCNRRYQIRRLLMEAWD